MEWREIMKMQDPHEALKQIESKVEREDLPIEEMELMVEKYATLHGISVEEMAYYPNGESVLGS